MRCEGKICNLNAEKCTAMHLSHPPCASLIPGIFFIFMPSKLMKLNLVKPQDLWSMLLVHTNDVTDDVPPLYAFPLICPQQNCTKMHQRARHCVPPTLWVKQCLTKKNIKNKSNSKSSHEILSLLPSLVSTTGKISVCQHAAVSNSVGLL